jgi:hypothetical protein
MHEWILVGDMYLVAMSTNTMWQFLHWPSHICMNPWPYVLNKVLYINKN